MPYTVRVFDTWKLISEKRASTKGECEEYVSTFKNLSDLDVLITISDVVLGAKKIGKTQVKWKKAS